METTRKEKIQINHVRMTCKSYYAGKEGMPAILAHLWAEAIKPFCRSDQKEPVYTHDDCSFDNLDAEVQVVEIPELMAHLRETFEQEAENFRSGGNWRILTRLDPDGYFGVHIRPATELEMQTRLPGEEIYPPL